MDRFDQISTFVRVVELGGFAAAARDLGVAPSLVTTHIQALEQRLGARLLNRNTRHVKPTEVGEAYYKYCVDVISRFDEAEALVESMQAQAAWRLAPEYVSVDSQPDHAGHCGLHGAIPGSVGKIDRHGTSG
jgi:DNA-binding transcriptional LysR family regulator